MSASEAEMRDLDQTLRERRRGTLAAMDAAARSELGSKAETDRETLLLLAFDQSPDVRASVARNTAAPPAVLLALISDQNPHVQATAAAALRRIVCNPDQFNHSDYRFLFASLQALVHKATEALRWTLLEIMTVSPHVPRDILLDLAQDPDAKISQPILQHADALSDTDLISFVREVATSGQLFAIASRTRLSAELSDAVARTLDETAVSTLLKNRGAQIREQTLDFITDNAPRHRLWHDPLVSRGDLSSRLMVKIAGFVADDLVLRLSRRSDLDPQTLSTLRNGLLMRLKQRGVSGSGNSLLDPTMFELSCDLVQSLGAAGRLTDDRIVASANDGLTSFTLAALAYRAAVDRQTVFRAVSSGRPASLVALCWAANLTAEQCERIQSNSALYAGPDVMRPTREGWYRLTENAMLAELSLLRREAGGEETVVSRFGL